MTDQDAVPPGYKRTEVGVIPEDWEVHTLGQMTVLLTNGFVGKVKDFYTDSNDSVLYVQGYNVQPNCFNYQGICRVSRVFHEAHKKSCLKEGDLLTIQTGDVGVTALVSSELIGANCHALIISRLKKQYYEPSYYCQYFNSERGRVAFKEIETGTTMKHLNVGDMIDLSLPFPPFPEQHAIAAALSDVDGLIGALDALITKKRDMKQAAMQQLLTGRTRLSEFEGEWVVKSIREITKIPVTDGPHMTPKFLSEGIPFLSVNNLANNLVDITDLRYISQSDHDEFSKKCRPKKWDILLGKAASVGKVALVDFDWEFNIWSPIALIRVGDQYVPRFVCYSLQTSEAIKQIEFFTNSSSQGNIGMGDIEKIMVNLPSPKEQTAIASVLSDMDIEIAALERRRDKAKEIKQGMMQQLLTGKVRLIKQGS